MFRALLLLLVASAAFAQNGNVIDGLLNGNQINGTVPASAINPGGCASGYYPNGTYNNGVANCSQIQAGQILGLAASATTDTTSASNIGSGTLASARLPTTALQTNIANTLAAGGSLAPGSGTITGTNFSDFPAKVYYPAAACNNATAGAGWSLPTASAPTVACHTGTYVQDGYLQFADGQSAQFSFLIPDDWDSASSLDAKTFFTDSATSGTVIFQISLSCSTTGGTATDDAAFNTAQSFGTVTLSTPASAGRTATLTGITKTGCSAGSFVHVKISRTTDTASGVANVSGLQLTVRRTF